MKTERKRLFQPVILTEGSIPKKILAFALPLFLGQLLQQLYNMADAWVIGNFADNNSFAAVTSGGSLTFMVIGFFSGIAMGGGIVISKYYGAGNMENTRRAIHTNFLIGLLASVLATVIGLTLIPDILRLMNTPEEVLPEALAYFRVYFAGVSTIIMYNIGTAIMQALGDSVHPLMYLTVSSVTNVVLDLLFVAVFHWGVTGAAAATVFSQGLSACLCIAHLLRGPEETRLCLRELKFDGSMLKNVIAQGLPTGIQNSVISLGNTVIQSSINMFGAYAMSGHGAYSRLGDIIFLPIGSLSMSLPTFVSQNLGAGKKERAKEGARFGIIFGMILAELLGLVMFFAIPSMLKFLIKEEEAIRFGVIHCRTVSLFFCLLAFSHCCAGTLRGCGKSVVPMVVMLGIWCGLRIVYVTIAVRFFPSYRTVATAYPLTWTISSILYLVSILRLDWDKALRNVN